MYFLKIRDNLTNLSPEFYDNCRMLRLNFKNYTYLSYFHCFGNDVDPKTNVFFSKNSKISLWITGKKKKMNKMILCIYFIPPSLFVFFLHFHKPIKQPHKHKTYHHIPHNLNYINITLFTTTIQYK
mgnify:CR=1 FL=1